MQLIVFFFFFKVKANPISVSSVRKDRQEIISYQGRSPIHIATVYVHDDNASIKNTLKESSLD